MPRIMRRLITRYNDASLEAKLALQVAFSTAFTFALLLPLVLQVQRQALLSAVEASGFKIAEIFAASSVPAVAADDYLMMQNLINGIASEPRVLYAMLLKDDGEVLAHSQATERGKRYGDAVAVRAAGTDTRVLQRYEAPDGRPVYDFAVPIYVLAEKRASARLGLSIEQELAGIARTRNSILVLGLSVLAFSLAWTMHQSRRLTRPLRALVRGTQEITRGHLDHRFDVKAADEIGQLALAFNAMSSSLAVAQADLVRKARLAAIGEIAAAVAHETRNPLGALSNCVQLLGRNPHLTPEDAELLGIIRTECLRLNEIVSEFLAFGRPRPPHFHDVDVHELIEETVALLQKDERCPASLPVERRFDPSLGRIRADRDQLRQVLWNLCVNALQAAGKGLVLSIATRRSEGRVEMSIRDNGPGIPASFLPGLFEPFVTTKREGMGLGLAIVRRIIEEHGGEVRVESEEGVGTRFTLSLPVAPAPAPSHG